MSSSTAILAAKKESIPVDALPESLKIVDCEKRRGVARYYCYIIEVIRKNRDVYHIYRRYKKFDKMVTRLEERFPVEAGSIRASDRIIPLLPGKKYAKRSAVRNITEERLPLLNEFLQKLYIMSDKIRYDSIVIAFLKQTHEDINNPYKPNIAYPGRSITTRAPPTRPKSPKPPSRSSLSPSRPPPPSLPLPSIHVTTGGTNRPLLSNKPAKPPPPKPNPPNKAFNTNNTPRAKALYNYTARYSDELTFQESNILTLIRKVDGSWYQCKLDDSVGLVPGNYLNIIQGLSEEDEDGTSEDEWDDDDDNGIIYCRYKGKNMSNLKDAKIVLNYKDGRGDLIEMVDDEDVQIMTEEGMGLSLTGNNRLLVPSSVTNNNWMIYVTNLGDTSVYHTHPYKKPKPV